MYRALLSFFLVSTCISMPMTGPRTQQLTSRGITQDSDIVDSLGAGYSFFHNQNIDMRPTTSRTVDIPPEDLEDYLESSAFEQPRTSINQIYKKNTYPSNQMHYQSQPQRTFPSQGNFGFQQVQPMRSQQRPYFNTAPMYSQYQMQSVTPPPRQPIYGNGW